VSCSLVMLPAALAIRWNASLLGQKMVMSERSSRGATRSTCVAAPARAVQFPVTRVSETLSGMRRSLSMMWMTPLSNSRSWFFWSVWLGLEIGGGLTYGYDHLARRFDATGDDGIAFFVQVNGNDLSAYRVKGSSQLGVSDVILGTSHTSNIATADFAIQHETGVVEITRHKLRDLDDVRRLHHALEQVVPQDLLDESGVDGRLIDAEDATTLDDSCKGIVARREERDILLRGEELGRVFDFAEQSHERGERFLARKHCCEVLCRGEGGGGCCEEMASTHCC
jgi:hypothetical protein